MLYLNSTMRLIFGIVAIGLLWGISLPTLESQTMDKEIVLPAPRLKSEVSLEEAISQRRSIRRYRPEELTIGQISQLLWSAQGITEGGMGFRAAPSAGALYPAEIYLVKKDGVFHYKPGKHRLKQVLEGDVRDQLAEASWGQKFIAQAPVDIVITMVYERVTSRYGPRGRRYTDIEVGHIAQNIHLQAVV